MVQVTHAIALEAPDKVLSERMSGRWVHPRSGRAYHDVACPPKSLINSFDANRDQMPEPTASNMFDDETGEPLTQRTADNEMVFTIALRNYYSQTLPVLEHYQKKTARSVDSDGTVGSVMEVDTVLGDQSRPPLATQTPVSPASSHHSAKGSDGGRGEEDNRDGGDSGGDCDGNGFTCATADGGGDSGAHRRSHQHHDRLYTQEASDGERGAA